MRLLTIPVALTLAVLAAAYPRPQQWSDFQGQQQHPMTPAGPFQPTQAYARFDQEQVLRVEVSSLKELKMLEAIVEVTKKEKRGLNTFNGTLPSECAAVAEFEADNTSPA